MGTARQSSKMQITFLSVFLGLCSARPLDSSNQEDDHEGSGSEDYPRVQFAALSGDDYPDLVLTWSDGYQINVPVTSDGDCVYSGHMPVDDESMVMVTGCDPMELGVQITSEVWGDMVFNTKDSVVIEEEIERAEAEFDYNNYSEQDSDDGQTDYYNYNNNY